MPIPSKFWQLWEEWTKGRCGVTWVPNECIQRPYRDLSGKYFSLLHTHTPQWTVQSTYGTRSTLARTVTLVRCKVVDREEGEVGAWGEISERQVFIQAHRPLLIEEQKWWRHFVRHRHLRLQALNLKIYPMAFVPRFLSSITFRSAMSSIKCRVLFLLSQAGLLKSHIFLYTRLLHM